MTDKDNAILKQASVNLEDFDSGFDTKRKLIASASHHLVRALDILNVMDNKEAAHAVSHVIHKMAENVKEAQQEYPKMFPGEKEERDPTREKQSAKVVGLMGEDLTGWVSVQEAQNELNRLKREYPGQQYRLVYYN